jgi:hypothetical protein
MTEIYSSMEARPRLGICFACFLALAQYTRSGVQLPPGIQGQSSLRTCLRQQDVRDHSNWVAKVT